MRRGFTLVELLVVLVIVVTLVAVVVGALSPSNSETVRTAARVLQSHLNLAKNSASFDRAVRGVRLERDALDSRICRSLSLIGSSGHVDGTLSDVAQFVGDTTTYADNYWRISGSVSGHFQRLATRGLLGVGSHIQIPAGSGQWFTLSAKEFDPANNRLSLAQHVTESQWNGAGAYAVVWPRDALGNLNVTFRLELGPASMSAVSPLALPKGTAIDLDASHVPSTWHNPSTNCDILFDAGGNTTGGIGLIHLYVTRLQDVELTRNMFSDHPANGGSRAAPIVPANPPHVPLTEPFAVTVMKMGNAYASPVRQADGNLDLQADDPFLHARMGRESQ